MLNRWFTGGTVLYHHLGVVAIIIVISSRVAIRLIEATSERRVNEKTSGQMTVNASMKQ